MDGDPFNARFLLTSKQKSKLVYIIAKTGIFARGHNVMYKLKRAKDYSFHFNPSKKR